MAKILKLTAPLLYLLLISCTVFGQTEDVIYLSDGSIIRGRIISDSAGTHVRILNHAGDTWSFDRSNVDSIRQEKPFEYKAMIFNQRGMEFAMNGSMLVRSGSNVIGRTVIPCFDLSYGYRFRSVLSTGAGVGVDFYQWLEVPVTAYVRFRASGTTIAPVLFLKTGYAIAAEKRNDDGAYSYTSTGGPLVIVGVGVERILSENASFILSFAWHYQELNYHLTPKYEWELERERKEIYSRLSISLGYIFK